ncbi:MAG: glycoside hydrolase family protein [Verrucomicrobiales bacterium]|nr:glycoside hydrolase family protein [Verrucomicrobiales bacterium]
MIRLFPIFIVLCWWVEARAAELYHEQFRPQFHFTPATNWMNDPNGMVFYDGEYHLFYQFNPFGNKWGHMSWGHSVSPDLVHWEHLPVALYEENDVMIFSGSAVVDWKNTSGFGQNGKPPLVAIYTGHYTKKPLQNQNIAYSNDRGRTWVKYANNPALDIGEKDFRDPKVSWHEASKRWIMTVSWPVHHQVRFYASTNLKEWTHLSDFGPAGSTQGIWECPDLFPLKNGRGTKWVLVVNVGSGAPAGGSGCQYFVGDFDGSKFTLDSSFPTGKDAALWADYGRDFYAAVSWSDVPKRDGRRLWLGWMSNWEYANDVPTSPWRSAMSVPRELTLRKTPEGLRMVQQPVEELRKLRGAHHRLGNASFSRASNWLAGRELKSELLEMEMDFTVEKSSGDFGIKIASGANEETVVRLSKDGRLSLDRTQSGRTDFHRKFPGVHEAKLSVRNGVASLHLFLDTSSIEVFANEGEAVLTDLILPTGDKRKLELISNEQAPRVMQIHLWELKSAWK